MITEALARLAGIAAPFARRFAAEEKRYRELGRAMTPEQRQRTHVVVCISGRAPFTCSRAEVIGRTLGARRSRLDAEAREWLQLIEAPTPEGHVLVSFADKGGAAQFVPVRIEP